MNQPLITLTYRQVIDANHQTTFEQYVFEDTYAEFLLQVQTYNPEGKYTTWQQVRAAVPSAAQQLPVRVGFAIGQSMQALQNRIPGLWDTLELHNLLFTDYQFLLLASDVTDKAAHRVALLYRTPPMRLVQTVGNYLILAPGEPPPQEGPLETFTVEMRPNLSVSSYQEAAFPPAAS